MDIRLSLFWVCAAVIGIAELLILRAALFPPPTAAVVPPPRFSDQASETDDIPAVVPRSPRAIEVLWGILPAIALGVLLWAAWRALH